MERYIGGTEIQLGVIPLNGKVIVDEAQRRYAADRVVEELISVNNKTRLYGVPTSNLADSGIATWLFNGGLIYHDLGHPEYATPECRSLEDIVAYEMAGRRIVENLLRLGTFRNPTHSVFANNSDHHGNTFAYHENYLTERRHPSWIASSMLPFLVTRQIFCGAGLFLSSNLRTYKKLKGEFDLANDPSIWFSISQRSMAANMKLEKLWIGQYSHFAGASRNHASLLHVTGGDANFTRKTTKLKIGTTALVQQMVEDGFKVKSRLAVTPDRACGNLINIALDLSFKWIFNNKDYSCPAVAVQRVYLEEARRRFAGRDGETDWTLRAWEVTLDQLETNPLKATWVDWVRKFNFLAPRLHSSGWSEEELIRADLGFHAADPDRSIVRLLGGTGIDDAKIVHAMHHPPADTRAAGRGLAIRALDPIVGSSRKLPSIVWGSILFGKTASLIMPDPRQTYLEDANKFKSQIESI